MPRIPGLDKQHIVLFHKIFEKSSIESEEFGGLCDELGLFANGALEILNETAYDICDEPLIEEGEPYIIDLKIAKELLECQMPQ